ncbi:4Fe-4S dicluster domain-containing protein [Oleidesulfovibrio sp.]|uniref:4Fe-4S dicluster domain-containing protein n=1 Tax=Oleidesulfovibrio sp. TaxID=2909707 RepID=UPI003A8BE606
MSRYRLKLNKKRCIHCKACEVHCKAKNNTPKGIKLGVHTSSLPEMVDGVPRMKASYQCCYHCENPECVDVCPTEAMIRRESDGIVYVDQETCIGCEACVDACPWHIPTFNPDTGTVLKCDFCMDRVDAGLLPACVTACTTHALSFTKK